jgi:hypothetical protein
MEVERDQGQRLRRVFKPSIYFFVMLSGCEASLFSYMKDNSDPSQSLRMTAYGRYGGLGVWFHRLD